MHGPVGYTAVHVPDNVAVEGLVGEDLKRLRLMLAALTGRLGLGPHIKHCCDKMAATRQDYHPGRFGTLRSKLCKAFQQGFGRQGPLPAFSVWLQQATPDQPAWFACISQRELMLLVCNWAVSDEVLYSNDGLHATHAGHAHLHATATWKKSCSTRPAELWVLSPGRHCEMVFAKVSMNVLPGLASIASA